MKILVQIANTDKVYAINAKDDMSMENLWDCLINQL